MLRVWSSCVLQDGDEWQAVVNAVMHLWIAYRVGNFLTSGMNNISKKTLMHGISL
jgi:hypothetical protein